MKQQSRELLPERRETNGFRRWPGWVLRWVRRRMGKRKRKGCGRWTPWSNVATSGFEERLALLVDREVHARNDRKLVRLLKNAHLKYGQAAIEGVDTRPSRGIDRREVISMALGDWVSAGHSVLIIGPTRAGKFWLACTLAQYACRRGHSVLYLRILLNVNSDSART